jgi:hypothetical protein
MSHNNKKRRNIIQCRRANIMRDTNIRSRRYVNNSKTGRTAEKPIAASRHNRGDVTTEEMQTT